MCRLYDSEHNELKINNMKKVKVNIKVKEMVCYDQEIEITEEQYLKLKQIHGEDIASCDGENYYLIDDLVDRQNVLCTEEEFIEFKITRL